VKNAVLRRDPGSFRDPSGHVFARDGRIFRSVTTHGAPAFDAAWQSGVLRRMAAAGRLIETGELAQGELAQLLPVVSLEAGAPVRVLTHPRLPLVSYAYEWPYEALRAAALAHLDLQLALLDEGFTLSDASAFNMQLDGPKPVHIDILSVVPYAEGAHWAGYEQFQRHFLNPLLIEQATGMSFAPLWRGTLDGVSSDDTLRLLPLGARLRPSTLMHVTMPALANRRAVGTNPVGKGNGPAPLPRSRLASLIGHLQRTIAGLGTPRGRTTPWLDYAANNTYASVERGAKHEAVAKFAARVRPGLLLDIGTNTGEYAAVALAAGARRVVGLETDRAALDAAFLGAARHGMAFLPLSIDFTNPSPAQGWRGEERAAFFDRLSADALVALAVIHHIVMRNNVPLAEAVEQLVGVAPRGLIEFVPKGDPQVTRLLKYRADVFHDYETEAFRSYLSRHARIVVETRLTGSGRILFEYERASARA
jgi:ribosomal protein L11 methylase PrmA